MKAKIHFVLAVPLSAALFATVAPMPAPTKQLNLLCVDADGAATETFRLPVALATGEEVSGRILLILAVVDHAVGENM